MRFGIVAARQRGQQVGGLVVTKPKLVVQQWFLTTFEDGVRSKEMTTVVVEVTTAVTCMSDAVSVAINVGLVIAVTLATTLMTNVITAPLV